MLVEGDNDDGQTDSAIMTNLLFVQMGFGVDQHGSRDATKAAIRAVRNAIEFNSIPGVIEAVPGGRQEMLIHVKLGVPAVNDPIRIVQGKHNESRVDVVHGENDANKDNGDSTTPTATSAVAVAVPSTLPLPVDFLEVAKVFPYGKLLPIEVTLGGLSFPTGRVVEELGDKDDAAVCVAACVSIGYNDGSDRPSYTSYSTVDGY